MCLTASSSHRKQARTERRCSWNYITGTRGDDVTSRPLGPKASGALKQCCASLRSTRESSCFTVVLNNLRVFLIFDWLQLVREFLQGPAETAPGGEERRQRCHSSGSSDSYVATTGSTATVMPKTVKSGVVTKRSTVAVTQDRCLEVKVNVTGQWKHAFIHISHSLFRFSRWISASDWQHCTVVFISSVLSYKM